MGDAINRRSVERNSDSCSDKVNRIQQRCDDIEIALQACKKELTIATEQLEAAKVSRNNFLSHMSHELRTPLNAILGFSRLMGDDSNLTEKQVENLGLIHQSGELLLNLIDNVLSIAKIDAGLESVDANTLDFPEFIREVAAMFNSRATGHGLAFSLDLMPGIPRYINCDERKLQQILINLMDNSVKFTDTGGIEMKVWSTDHNPDQDIGPVQDQQGQVQPVQNQPVQNQPVQNQIDAVNLCFELRDTGRGIAPELLETIFDPFFTELKNDTQNTGHGLGLTISRDFARMMGGDIAAANRRDKGTKITFHIVVEPAPAPTKEDQYRVTSIGPTKTGQRILVVDDDGASRFLLSELLSEVGFKVREAENGEKAVALFFEWRPHLIFMDIRMPLMNGMVATKIIKATREGRKIPVIALTAHAIDEKRRNILAAGCDGYIRKPFEENEIFETIAKHLDLAYILKSTARKQISPQKIRPQDTLGTLTELPVSVLKNLKQSALALDMENTYACLDHIQTLDSSLGNSLIKLAKRFRFSQISKLADQAIRLAK